MAGFAASALVALPLGLYIGTYRPVQALLEPLKKTPPALEFRTTPLTELIRFLSSRDDIEYARVRFAGTDLTFTA